MLSNEQLSELDEKHGHKVIDAYISNADDKIVRNKIGDKYHLDTTTRAELEKYKSDLDNAAQKINASEVTFSDLTERLKKLVK